MAGLGGGLVLITGGSYCSTSGCAAQLPGVIRAENERGRQKEKNRRGREKVGEREGESIGAYLYRRSNMKTHSQ